MPKYRVSGLLNYCVWESKQIEVEVEAATEYDAMCIAGAQEAGYEPENWNDYFDFQDEPEIEVVKEGQGE